MNRRGSALKVGSLSAEEIREYARSRKTDWQRFLEYVERATKSRRSDVNLPRSKRAYLVFHLENAGLDLLLDLRDGEIYEIVNGKFKGFLMDYDKAHLNERQLLAPAEDVFILEFAERTHKLDPKFIKKLFLVNMSSPFVEHLEHDSEKPVRHYYYDLFCEKRSSNIVIGVVVICKDPKPGK